METEYVTMLSSSNEIDGDDDDASVSSVQHGDDDDASVSSVQHGDDDILGNEFLMNAISAIQEGSEEDDGIDEIDVDFDEGDCDTLIQTSADTESANRNEHGNENCLRNDNGELLESSHIGTNTSEEFAGSSNGANSFSNFTNLFDSKDSEMSSTSSGNRSPDGSMSCEVWDPSTSEERGVQGCYIGRKISSLNHQTEYVSYNWPYPCTECRQSFPIKSALSKHLTKVHHRITDIDNNNFRKTRYKFLTSARPYRSFFRKQLSFSDAHKETATRQINEQTNSQTYVYPMLCPVYFVVNPSMATVPPNQYSTAGAIQQHPSFVCGICQLKFVTSDDLSIHVSMHATSKTHKCARCGLLFKDECDLVRHYRHHSETPFHGNCVKSLSVPHLEELKCRVCLLLFATRADYLDHMQQHMHEDCYKCHLCIEIFQSVSQLNSHILNCHTDKPFERTNEGQDSLIQHERKRRYVCEECGGRFLTSNQKKCHKLTHTLERPYKCDLCDASFKQQGNMKRHRWIHTRERPYICEDCDAAFPSKSELKRHNRTHTGECPYKCHLCPGKYSTSGNLRSHLKFHAERTELNVPID